MLKKLIPLTILVLLLSKCAPTSEVVDRLVLQPVNEIINLHSHVIIATIGFYEINQDWPVNRAMLNSFVDENNIDVNIAVYDSISFWRGEHDVRIYFEIIDYETEISKEDRVINFKVCNYSRWITVSTTDTSSVEYQIFAAIQDSSKLQIFDNQYILSSKETDCD